MKQAFFCLIVHWLFSISLSAYAQQPAGVFDSQTNVGATSGTARYDPATHSYEITSKGSSKGDHFHYLWKRLKGDFILYARVRQLDPASQIGWVASASLSAESPQVRASVTANGPAQLRFRASEAGNMAEKSVSVQQPDIIQLERSGTTFTLRVAKFGEPFHTQEVSTIDLGADPYVGLFVSSQSPANVAKARFEDVRITVPVSPDESPNRMNLGSRLEILDVFTGKRTVIHTAPNSIQAPNWTPDGKTLLYNGQGVLYTFDLASKQQTVLNTGTVKNNNNDHVLSFDGKMIGLSSGVKELGGSIIYTVPIMGGTPKQITPQGPSYLHGWSPDGNNLVFCGARNDEYDVYKISANGGPETRLTTATGLDDGPEYTPNGQYIYFNSNRTGTMQIWRMKPDGSQQEAVTSGEFHDWFPHISPDGKWIVFLSFLKEEVKSGDHPPYKHVYLRLMPVSGGQSKVVAYVYGGQGSINTPSWSPDSKRIAFISNTEAGVISPVEVTGSSKK
ncbi:SMP-30/gluconolactonase/LRE family protein [Spirosoma terrae]|uniref:TolB family protein n=1 Tax=Spirosoma terrae TaxID=1968276 RepID=A0A6L9LAC4_9BACT|nr:PD40 domain-containing protein [Spirosoma terrae]NDU97390.1 TolB family protein [Spirosoma terrae]